MGTLAVIYILQQPSLNASVPSAEIPAETLPFGHKVSDKSLLQKLNYVLLWGLQTWVRSSFMFWPNAALVQKQKQHLSTL